MNTYQLAEDALIEHSRLQREALCKNYQCGNGGEPGWIESDNNGPIYPCPNCNPTLMQQQFFQNSPPNI